MTENKKGASPYRAAPQDQVSRPDHSAQARACSSPQQSTNEAPPTFPRQGGNIAPELVAWLVLAVVAFLLPLSAGWFA